MVGALVVPGTGNREPPVHHSALPVRHYFLGKGGADCATAKFSAPHKKGTLMTNADSRVCPKCCNKRDAADFRSGGRDFATCSACRVRKRSQSAGANPVSRKPRSVSPPSRSTAQHEALSVCTCALRVHVPLPAPKNEAQSTSTEAKID